MGTNSRNHGVLSVNWWGSTAPSTLVSLGAITWVGAQFALPAGGRIFGARMYVPAAGSSPAAAVVWNDASLILAIQQFYVQTFASNGWINVWFRPTGRLATADTIWLACIQGGSYYRTPNALASGPVTHNGITMNHGFTSTSNAPWLTSPTLNNHENGVDLLWHT